eukprot:Nk52_evm37s1763 gene=Nk52_evmTU37s1763
MATLLLYVFVIGTLALATHLLLTCGTWLARLGGDVVWVGRYIVRGIRVGIYGPDGDPEYVRLRERDRANRFKTTIPPSSRGKDPYCRESYMKHREQILSTPWDVVVVGSGIGGMSCAALLAKYGKKVLVLEQHEVLGGCCHCFEERGFEWDTGLHYVGKLNRPSSEGTQILTFITEGRSQWCMLDDIYDQAVFHADGLQINCHKDISQYIKNLCDVFPQEQANIERYFTLCKKVADSFAVSLLHRSVPKRLQGLVKGMLCAFFGFYGCFVGKDETPWYIWYHYAGMTTEEVLCDITSNEDLRKVLNHPLGDYGMPVSEASFGMHAQVVGHYLYGAAYPVGGPQQITRAIVPCITRNRGLCVVKAEVEEVLINDDKAACGVRMSARSPSKYGDCVFADKVVCACGVYLTISRLVPRSARHFFCRELAMLKRKDRELDVDFDARTEFMSLLAADRSFKSIEQSTGHVYLFVGFKGCGKEELGVDLPRRNIWHYNSKHIEEDIAKFKENIDSPLPMCFYSFPSEKDPSYRHRFPGTATCVALCEAPYEWFERFKTKKKGSRGEEYNSLKQKISVKMFDIVFSKFPTLRDKVAYYKVATPVTNNYYLHTLLGESYGMEHTPHRFVYDEITAFASSSVQDLYFSGQDIVSAGFSGAMFGGLLSASAVLGRPLLVDLLKDKHNRQLAASTLMVNPHGDHHATHML